MIPFLPRKPVTTQLGKKHSRDHPVDCPTSAADTTASQMTNRPTRTHAVNARFGADLSGGILLPHRSPWGVCSSGGPKRHMAPRVWIRAYYSQGKPRCKVFSGGIFQEELANSSRTKNSDLIFVKMAGPHTNPHGHGTPRGH